MSSVPGTGKEQHVLRKEPLSIRLWWGLVPSDPSLHLTGYRLDSVIQILCSTVPMSVVLSPRKYLWTKMGYIDMTPKTQVTKVKLDRLDLIKINFAPQETPSRTWKDSLQRGETGLQITWQRANGIYLQSCAVTAIIQFQNVPSLQRNVPCLLAAVTPISPPTSPCQPLIYFLSQDWPILDICCKGNHAIFVLLWLASFTEHNVPRYIHAVACLSILFLSRAE